MNKKEETRIYKQAIETYGRDAQIGVCQEECAELIVILSKYERSLLNSKLSKRDSNVISSHIAEEIADVQIMLDQMEIVFGCKKEVAEIRNEKLNRLNKRIAKRGESK